MPVGQEDYSQVINVVNLQHSANVAPLREGLVSNLQHQEEALSGKLALESK